MRFHVSGRRAGDWDNLAKLVMDAIQDAGVLDNDMHATEAHIYVDKCARGEDRTEITLARRLPPG